MKKKVLGMLAIASVLFSKGYLYPDIMEVTDVNYKTDIVTLETSTGFVYQFKGTEDYYVDDLVAVVMFNNGTPNSIKDDKIIAHRYGGYWIDQKNKVTAFKD